MVSELKQEIAKNSIYNFTSAFGSKFISIFFTMVLARLMIPKDFGTYFFALSVSSIVLMFTDLGFGGTLQRYIANSLAKGNEKLARSYARYIFKIKIIILFSGSLILFFTAPLLSVFVFGKPEITLILQISSFYVIVESLNTFVMHSFMAVQDFRFKLVKEILFQITRFIFVPLILILGFGPEGALTGTIIAVAITASFSGLFFLKKYKYIFVGKTEHVPKRRLLKFVSYMTVYIVSATVFLWVDTLMLGAMLPMDMVGYYRAAGTLIVALISIVSIYQVVFPLISGQTEQNAKRTFQEAYRLMSILSFPITVGCIILATPLITLVYTTEYITASIPLIILSFLIIESASGSLIPTFFMAREKPRIPAFIFTFSIFVNVFFNYFLILAYGISGAAIASVISRFSNTSLLFFFQKREFGFLPTFSSIFKPLFSALIMGAIIILLPSPIGVLMTASYIAFGACIYFVLIYAINGITREDIKLVNYIFNSLIARS